MITESLGIVLHTFDYKETSLITHVYTKEYGRLSMIANSVRKRRPAFHRNLFQSLSLVKLIFYRNEKNDIQRIKDIKFEHSFDEIPFRIEKNTIALFLAEVLYKVIREHEENPSLFAFLRNSIEILDNLQEGISNFHLLFLIQLTRYIGFFPEDNYDDVNKYFNLFNGKYYPSVSNDMFTLDEVLSKKWHKATFSALNQPVGLGVNKAERKNLLSGILDYYMLHVGQLGEIKSYTVFHQVFG